MRLPAADEPKPDHVVDAEEQGQVCGNLALGPGLLAVALMCAAHASTKNCPRCLLAVLLMPVTAAHPRKQAPCLHVTCVLYAVQSQAQQVSAHTSLS